MFDQTFYATVLPDLVKAECAGQPGTVPVVELRLVDGTTLDVCHIPGVRRRVVGRRLLPAGRSGVRAENRVCPLRVRHPDISVCAGGTYPKAGVQSRQEQRCQTSRAPSPRSRRRLMRAVRRHHGIIPAQGSQQQPRR